MESAAVKAAFCSDDLMRFTSQMNNIEFDTETKSFYVDL